MMALTADIRRRARRIADSMCDGTSIYAGQPVARTVVDVLSRQIALTAGGRAKLLAYARKLEKTCR